MQRVVLNQNRRILTGGEKHEFLWQFASAVACASLRLCPGLQISTDHRGSSPVFWKCPG